MERIEILLRNKKRLETELERTNTEIEEIENHAIRASLRRRVERPDYRNNGQYQFIKGYTGGGNPMCVHLTKEQIIERLTKDHGPGRLEDDGVDLWWIMCVSEEERLANDRMAM